MWDFPMIYKTIFSSLHLHTTPSMSRGDLEEYPTSWQQAAKRVIKR